MKKILNLDRINFCSLSVRSGCKETDNVAATLNAIGAVCLFQLYFFL